MQCKNPILLNKTLYLTVLLSKKSNFERVFQLNHVNILHHAKMVFLRKHFLLILHGIHTQIKRKMIFIERMTVSHFIESEGCTSKLAPFQPQPTAEAAPKKETP